MILMSYHDDPVIRGFVDALFYQKGMDGPTAVDEGVPRGVVEGDPQGWSHTHLGAEGYLSGPESEWVPVRLGYMHKMRLGDA